jgi:hypothetical protein
VKRSSPIGFAPACDERENRFLIATIDFSRRVAWEAVSGAFRNVSKQNETIRVRDPCADLAKRGDAGTPRSSRRADVSDCLSSSPSP